MCPFGCVFPLGCKNRKETIHALGGNPGSTVHTSPRPGHGSADLIQVEDLSLQEHVSLRDMGTENDISNESPYPNPDPTQNQNPNQKPDYACK